MRRRRRMTRADRKRRALRNERRGRDPEKRPTMLASERARYYRYGGYVVRLLRGELRAVRVFRKPVHALPGTYPRAAMAYAPLPKRWREEIAAAARAETRRQRAKRLKEMGIDLPEPKVYEPLPTGAWT